MTSPPAIGDRFYRTWLDGTEPCPYHVRAVVDASVDGYHVVLRCWSAQRGWVYAVESHHAFDVGIFVRERKRPSQDGPWRRHRKTRHPVRGDGVRRRTMFSNDMTVRLRVTVGFDAPIEVEVKIPEGTLRDTLDSVRVEDPIWGAFLGRRNVDELQEAYVRAFREATVKLIKRASESAIHECAWEVSKRKIPDDFRG